MTVVNTAEDGKPHEFEVLAKMKILHYTNFSCYRLSWHALYLPSEAFKSVVKELVVMSYAYNVNDGIVVQMEAFIKNDTDTVEKTMNDGTLARSRMAFKLSPTPSICAPFRFGEGGTNHMNRNLTVLAVLC